MPLPDTTPTAEGIERMVLIQACADIQRFIGKGRALVMRPDVCREVLETIALRALEAVLDSREARAPKDTAEVKGEETT